MININNYIWVFGENLGLTANGNSYHLWKYAVNIKDNIEKYLVLDKNDSTSKIYKSLSKHEQKFVLWKNSLKHFKKFLNADLFFVSLNEMDVTPNKLFARPMKMQLKSPFIHLQTGVSGIKKLNENGDSYDNNIFRFLLYNKEMKNVFMEKHAFKSYQLHYSKYQPKYGDLIRKNNESQPKNIFWFLSFREYFKDDPIFVKLLSLTIKRVIDDERLIAYLKNNDLKLKICTHVLMEKQLFKELSKYKNEFIDVIEQKDADINAEIAESKLLISDYSSIIYDYSFIDKPYIIFQPDHDRFIEKRELYCDKDELKDFVVETPNELIERIINEKFEKHEYIEKAFPKEKEFDYVGNDDHLKDLYEYFKQLQYNKIAFIGYNFYGIGGTVNATMALAESLLQAGYLVSAISLKKLSQLQHKPPAGLNMDYMTWDNTNYITEKIKRRTHRSPKYYYHFNYDSDKIHVHPYACYELNNLMKDIRAKTVVSTRETLHLFLDDASSEHVKNKIFFFHTIADAIPTVFPNLMDELNKINLDKAVFITKQNRIALKEQFSYENYNHYIELGNTLIQSKMLKKEEIKGIEKKERYNAIYLLRISEDRKNDIENLIEFGKYVKKSGIEYIEIDVYGTGDYVEEFIDLIQDNNLNDIIHYKLSTKEPIEEIRKHDLMIDFTYNHSFGMTYIEAIMNGKKVFCMKNRGSLEVMENIPNSYIESYEWLCEQIADLDKISCEELKDNYDKINEKYSQETIANKFLEFID